MDLDQVFCIPSLIFSVGGLIFILLFPWYTAWLDLGSLLRLKATSYKAHPFFEISSTASSAQLQPTTWLPSQSDASPTQAHLFADPPPSVSSAHLRPTTWPPTTPYASTQPIGTSSIPQPAPGHGPLTPSGARSNQNASKVGTLPTAPTPPPSPSGSASRLGISRSLRECLQNVEEKFTARKTTCGLRTRDPGGIWFPHGDDIVHHGTLDEALDDIVEHELQPYIGGVDLDIIKQSWESTAPRCIDPTCCVETLVLGLHIRGIPGRDGKYWAVDFKGNNSNMRVDSVVDALKPAIQKGMMSPADILIDAGDVPIGLMPKLARGCGKAQFGNPGILFAVNKRAADSNVVAFIDTTFRPYKHLSDVRTSGKARDWDSRDARLFFIGEGGGYRKCLNREMLSAESEVLAINIRQGCWGTGSPAEAVWCNFSKFVPHPEHCKYKYLLHLPGTSGSFASRLKFLFPCGSVIIIPQQPFYEFWYPMMRPFEDFIPSGNIQQTGGKDLPEIVRCLRSHDADARKLAENAARFFDERLTQDMPMQYVRKLLKRFSSLLNYDPHGIQWPDPSAWAQHGPSAVIQVKPMAPPEAAPPLEQLEKGPFSQAERAPAGKVVPPESNSQPSGILNNSQLPISKSLRRCLWKVQKQIKAERCPNCCFQRPQINFDPVYFEGSKAKGVWFPHGSTIIHHDSLAGMLDDIVEHELKPFQRGITRDMVQQAWNASRPKCCDSSGSGVCKSPYGPNNIGLKIRGRRFTEHFRKENQNARVSYMIDDILKPEISKGNLASADILLDVGDVPQGLRKEIPTKCGMKATEKPSIVFAANKREEDRYAIAFLMNAYGERDMVSIRKEGNSYAWSKRQSRLFFNGAGIEYRMCLNRNMLSEDSDVLAVNFRTGCKASEGSWCKFNRMWSREQHCHYKYLLHLPGTSGSFSSRLRFLFPCASVVIIPQQAFYEFWYPMLRPYEHFIPAGNLMITRGRDLPGIIRCLNKHEDDARRLAENAGRFADQILTKDLHLIYARKLLNRFSSLLRYNLTHSKYRRLKRSSSKRNWSHS